MGEFCWISIILSQVVKFSLSGERSGGFAKNITVKGEDLCWLSELFLYFWVVKLNPNMFGLHRSLFTEERDLFRQSVRDFIAKEIIPNNAAWEI